MNTTLKEAPPNEIGFDPTNFVHLKNITFAEYQFKYHLNDCYGECDLSGLRNKDQLLFQKMSPKNHQLNLILVDSMFPILLSDIVLEVFIRGISSFEQYKAKRVEPVLMDMHLPRAYLHNKLFSFMDYLLYSKIAASKVWNGRFDYETVFYRKDGNGEIQYYPVYNRKELFEYMMPNVQLGIDKEKSFVKGRTVSLCFTIKI